MAHNAVHMRTMSALCKDSSKSRESSSKRMNKIRHAIMTNEVRGAQYKNKGVTMHIKALSPSCQFKKANSSQAAPVKSVESFKHLNPITMRPF